MGLSNMFNWIIGEKMIGEINYAHVNYVLDDLGAVTRAARIGPGIRRITQELNVGNLDK